MPDSSSIATEIQPDRAAPGQLPVGLEDSDVIVVLTFGRGVIFPGQINFGGGALGFVGDGKVLEEDELLDRGRARDMDFELGIMVDCGDLALDVFAGLEIEDDVVGGAVGVTLANRLEDGFATGFVGVDVGVGNMGGAMVGTGDDAEFVAFLPCFPDKAFFPVTARVCGALGLFGARGAFILIGIAASLINFDDRFGDGVVDAPVGSRLGAGRVCDGESAGFAGVDVEFFLRVFVGGRGALAAFGPDDVMVAVGVIKTPFITVKRNEIGGGVENVGDFLRPPPDVIESDSAPLVVIGGGDKIKGRRVDSITEHIGNGTIGDAVP